MFFEHVWGKVAGALFLEGGLHFYQVDGTRAKGNAGGPSVLLAYGEENAQLLRQCPLKGAYCTKPWLARSSRQVCIWGPARVRSRREDVGISTHWRRLHPRPARLQPMVSACVSNRGPSTAA